MMRDTIIYTAIFGGKDELHEPTVKLPGCRLICFTDRHIESEAWEVDVVESDSPDPRRAAKRYKVLPHKFFHAKRGCVYDEAQACIDLSLDDKEMIDAQVQRYREEGYPKHAGLAECGLLCRVHTPEIAKFNGAWWAEIVRGSKRDQISFPYVLRKLGMKCATIPGDIQHGSKYVKWHSHAI